MDFSSDSAYRRLQRQAVFPQRHVCSLGRVVEGPVIDLGGIAAPSALAALEMRQPRSVLVANTAEGFAAQQGQLPGFLRETLQLGEEPAVRGVCSWFFENTNGRAFIAADPCRQQAAHAVQTLPGCELRGVLKNVKWRGKKPTKVKLGRGLPTLPVKGLDFAYHGGRPRAETVTFTRQRILKSPAGPEVSEENILCKAERGEDAPHLALTQPPLIVTKYKQGGWWTCSTVLLAVVSDKPPFWVFHAHVALVPGEGQLIVVSAACRPLATVLQEYPVYDSLLRETGFFDE